MTQQEFWIVYLGCLATMLVCRCLPIFVLKGRELPAKVSRALSLIPPAAFAALVANDLFQPDLWAESPTQALLPLAASCLVCGVAVKTKSLALCAVVGVVAYALLGLLPF